MATEHIVEFEPFFRSSISRKGRWAPIRLFLEPFRDIWQHPLFRESGFEYAVRDPRELPRFGNGFAVYGENEREVGILCRIPPRLRFGVYAFHVLHVAPEGDITEVHHEHKEDRRWLGIRQGVQYDQAFGSVEWQRDASKPKVIRPQRSWNVALRYLVMNLREWEDPPVEPPEAQPEGEDLDALAGLF